MAQLEPELIPRRLKEARKACGRTMTQERVADVLGVHKRTVENDERAASLGVWERLNEYARIYNKPLEQFLWGDDVVVTDGSVVDRLVQLEASVDHVGEVVTEAMSGVVDRLARLERQLEPADARTTKTRRPAKA